MNGSELKHWRKLLGHTQEEAAKQFGVTRPTIQNWEYEITAVPLAVDLASQQLLRRWKQRPEFGPVVLVYASSPLWTVPDNGKELPTLNCKGCSDNRAAFIRLSELSDRSNSSNPMILDQENIVIWSGPLLTEEYERLHIQRPGRHINDKP